MATVRYSTRRGSLRNQIREDLIAKLRKETGPVLEKGIEIREEYTHDWSAYNKPRFIKNLGMEGFKFVAEITFDANPAPGSTENLSAYELLRDGTKVRRAAVSSDWKSKTAPNSLKARSGRGKIVKVDKSFEFPGIKKRNTDELANKEIQGDMDAAVKRAIEGR